MASQVGTQVATHDNNQGGVNLNGVEVVSILLSTETGGGNNDTRTMNVATSNGYNFAGLDSTAARTNSRAGLSFYRGAPAVPWPVNDRRRVVAVNMLAGSASHQPYEILYNQEFPNTTAARAAIDAVQAAPAGTSFTVWKAAYTFPDGQDGPADDPDRDGFPTLLEFHAATDPLDGSSIPTSKLTPTPTGFTYTYRRAKDRIGVTHTLQTGPLGSLTTFTPSGESLADISSNIEEITITLSPGFGPFLRQGIALTP